MEQNRVDMFILANGKFFESQHLLFIREQLLKLDDDRWGMIQMLQFKDPTTSLIVSLLGGSLGIDRFIIGDTGLGIAKLLTCGGLGIWTIVDWFLIQGVTRDKNLDKMRQALY
jgi:TM2 domain-containing membrane protein YozV